MHPVAAHPIVRAQPSVAGSVGRKVNVRSLVILAVALGLPIAVHLVPWGGATPLGAFLLPMYAAAFVAVYLYGPIAGVLVALFGPTINTFITRFPAMKLNAVMSFELVVFVVFAWLVMRNPRGRAFWLLAPLSYLVAKIFSTGVYAAGVEFFGQLGTPENFFMRSITKGAPGLLLLALINFALVRGWFENKNGGAGGAGGHGPEAAA